MATSVGADIESLCGKCGDVWHVVVAMVADRVAKVECKQCGRQHRHRPPNGATTGAARAAASSRRSTTTKKGTTRKTTVGAQSASNAPLIQIDFNKPLRSYTISEQFGVGDRIAHKRFGEGVVEMVLGPDKIQVFFAQGGRRVMAHGR